MQKDDLLAEKVAYAFFKYPKSKARKYKTALQV